MRLLHVLALGACAVALSGCGSQACPASLAETGVGVFYSGFHSDTELTTQVRVNGVCQVGAPSKGDSKLWLSVGIDPGVLRRAQVISVTVHDAANRVSARDQAVNVRRLSVAEGCTTTIYDAALRVSPDHMTAATRS